MSANPAAATLVFRQALKVTHELQLTDVVRSLQRVLHSSLGDAFRATQCLVDARKAYETSLRISVALKDLRGQGVDLHRLAALALTEGLMDDALAHYRAALRLFEEIGDRSSAAIAKHSIGQVMLERKRWTEAEQHTHEAARTRSELGDQPGAAQSWTQLATVVEKSGRANNAEALYRKALEAARKSRNPVLLRRQLVSLAKHLIAQTDNLEMAIDLLDEALSEVSLETLSPDVWPIYGLLADVLSEEGHKTGDPLRLEQSSNYRHIEKFGPRLQATLADIREEPSLARAVLLARLGRCLVMGGRVDIALSFLEEALVVTGQLPAGDDAQILQSAIEIEFARALAATGHLEPAQQARRRGTGAQ